MPRRRPPELLKPPDKDDKKQKLPQLPEDESDIVPRSTEQRIDLVAKFAQQVVPAQFPIRLHVADHRLDGAPPLQLFLI